MDYYIGIDLGGTNTKIGLLDTNGEIIFSLSVKTDSMLGYEKTIERLSHIIMDQITTSNISYDDVKGVGIGVPGPVVEQKIVKFFANFPWPENVNLAETFDAYLHKKIYVNNDVNVITLGEMWKGAAQGFQNVLGVAIGTGIGAGIVANGSLINGKNGAGGEIGHIKIVADGGKLCGCGQYGCWEAYASATGLIREAESRLKVNKLNKLFEMTNGREIEAKDIFDAAKLNDKFSLDLIEYETKYLAIGLGNALNIIDPEIVVIGGGVALAGDILFHKLQEKLPQYALPATLENLIIKPAKLGNDAGIIGAAYLAKKNTLETEF